jgi:hypothetical protein
MVIIRLAKGSVRGAPNPDPRIHLLNLKVWVHLPRLFFSGNEDPWSSRFELDRLTLFTCSLRTVFTLKFANRATDLKLASRDCCDFSRHAKHTAHSMTKYIRENK